MPDHQQSVTERAFLALAELTRRAADEEITTDLIYEVVCNWTTDEVGDKGPSGPDSIILGTYMVEHLSTQATLKENLASMQGVIDRILDHEIDPEKLAYNDDEEWERLRTVVELAGTDADVVLTQGELTLDDILEAAGSVIPHEGNWEEVANNALLEKIDYQVFMNEVLSLFLKATMNEDGDTVHDMIDELGCELTHMVTNTLLMWVHAKMSIGEDETLEDWVENLSDIAKRIKEMPVEDRIEFARDHFHEHNDED